MGLRAAEWLAVGDFVYLAICAGILPSTPVRTTHRRIVTAAGALGAALLVLLVARVSSIVPIAPAAVRDWAPAVYLLLGYWLPAGIADAPNVAIESRFMAWDDRLLGLWHDGAIGWFNRASVRVVVEIVYPLVHLMVPACFALMRYQFASRDADRFWTAVLIAGYICYGTLPWLHLRPPRRLIATHFGGYLRAWNEQFLESASVGASTFPSGHVATALTAALMVTEASPAAGAAFLTLTALIATATVAGRYHYAIDAIAGVLTGVAVWALC